MSTTINKTDAVIWLLQIEPGRYTVTGRKLPPEVKDSLQNLAGASKIDRSINTFRMIVPYTSLSALREQCQAFGITVQMIETDTASVATSQRHIMDDRKSRKLGRFCRIGYGWTFRFDR